MTTLTLVPDPAAPTDARPVTATRPNDQGPARRAAWACVAEGYAAAVDVPGLDDGELARFARCLRRAHRLAGEASA